MASYSDLTIHTVFETIWENWLNREGEASSLKAVTFFLKQDNKKEDLLSACEAYVLSVAGEDPKFTYKLPNFINMGHYLDVLELNNLDKLRKKKEEALHLINKWNEACRPHWLRSQAIEIRIPLAQRALENKYFRENWVEALGKAVKIFAYPFREGDPMGKLKLTFKWFANVDSDKHTCLRIMEGEFGSAHNERVIKVVETKPIDHEARQRLAEEVKAMFPDMKFKKIEKEKIQHPKLIISDEAKEIAKQAKSQLGKRPFIRRDNNPVEKIVSEVTENLPEGSSEESGEPDPFAFD